MQDFPGGVGTLYRKHEYTNESRSTSKPLEKTQVGQAHSAEETVD